MRVRIVRASNSSQFSQKSRPLGRAAAAVVAAVALTTAGGAAHAQVTAGALMIAGGVAGSKLASLDGQGLLGKVVARMAGDAIGEGGQASTPEKFPKPGLTSCASHFPRHAPVDLSAINLAWSVKGLCFDTFAVVYSETSKTPLLSVERLTALQLADALDEARTDQFYPEGRIRVGYRSELVDYQGSGFDRGHLSPAADQPNQGAMFQSFSLANIVPQDATNNRKVWSKVESDTRKYARRAAGNVFVFTGPLFLEQTPKTIGPGRVWVPSHLFKLVYDEVENRAWAHVLPNSADARLGAPMGYSAFVAKTGWKLLPATVRDIELTVNARAR